MDTVQGSPVGKVEGSIEHEEKVENIRKEEETASTTSAPVYSPACPKSDSPAIPINNDAWRTARLRIIINVFTSEAHKRVIQLPSGRVNASTFIRDTNLGRMFGFKKGTCHPLVIYNDDTRDIMHSIPLECSMTLFYAPYSAVPVSSNAITTSSSTNTDLSSSIEQEIYTSVEKNSDGVYWFKVKSILVHYYDCIKFHFIVPMNSQAMKFYAPGKYRIFCKADGHDGKIVTPLECRFDVVSCYYRLH
jgi:hypothetical protein